MRMAYECEKCDKQFRDGEGVEHEDDNALYFFCSIQCFKEWYANQETK